MGDHYFNLGYSGTDSCDDVLPYQILYDHQSPQDLVGFVFQHATDVEGAGWEVVAASAISMIFNNPPQCLLDAAEEPGLRSMHVYFKSYVETCLF